MSIKFSDTTTKKGLVQFYEKEIGASYGYVSGNTERLAEFTARVNNAIDNYLLIWSKVANKWGGEDINHSKYPVITLDIQSGKRDYTFDKDEQDNKIQDILKVLILESATDTEYQGIEPIDETDESISEILVNSNTGTPTQYGKMANGILLDPIPNYNATDGIKAVVLREGSYFVTTDTDKVPGVPFFHEYFYLKPAYEKARIDGLGNLSQLEKAIVDLEGNERLGVTGNIEKMLSTRSKDERRIMTHKKIQYI